MAILTKIEGRTEAEIDVQVDMVIKEIDEPKLHQYIPLWVSTNEVIAYATSFYILLVVFTTY